MPPKGFTCKQCGSCCLLSDAFSNTVDEDDVLMWETLGRDDILEWVAEIPVGEGHSVYDIWISPKTGDDTTRCPWLRKLPNQDKYICRIHDVKPRMCQEYPKSINHAQETGCKGVD